MNKADTDVFVDGLIVKPPRDGAPDFVKARISIKVAELMDWLGRQAGEWVNLDVKASRSGRWYAAVNTYSRQNSQAHQQPSADDDTPF